MFVSGPGPGSGVVRVEQSSQNGMRHRQSYGYRHRSSNMARTTACPKRDDGQDAGENATVGRAKIAMAINAFSRLAMIQK